jgi:hypothetical protein
LFGVVAYRAVEEAANAVTASIATLFSPSGGNSAGVAAGIRFPGSDTAFRPPLRPTQPRTRGQVVEPCLHAHTRVYSAARTEVREK